MQWLLELERHESRGRFKIPWETGAAVRAGKQQEPPSDSSVRMLAQAEQDEGVQSDTFFIESRQPDGRGVPGHVCRCELFAVATFRSSSASDGPGAEHGSARRTGVLAAVDEAESSTDTAGP